MLPLHAFTECATCGHRRQGTRAKAGSSVRCTGCGTMRRVPADRPTSGPDDPRATVPIRGRPLRPGNPWRIPPGRQSPRTAPARPPAPARRAGPAAARQAPVPAPQRPGRDLLPDLTPYQSCAGCQSQGKRTGAGTWPPAVTSLEFWKHGERDGRYYLCNPCRRTALATVASHPGWRAVEYPN
jgi:hypothetical protein